MVKGKILKMAYQAIYRKWRPMVFEDIVGQSHITETLKNQIITNKVGHAYLFCGTRGTGKTTAAKVFARAVNCVDNKDGSPCNECEICRGISDGSIMDVTEIDAASNNGVDNIREICEDTKYAAAAAKYRIYIIDEVHMLSTGAFNALLKTLEEPPEHIIFILATTDPHKVPQTILSRCQRFDFKRIKPSDIILRLKEIAYNEKLNISEDAYHMIARLGDGSMRDALSVLERVMSSLTDGDITAKTITDILGIAPIDTEFSMADAIISLDCDKIFEIISSICDEGRDLNVFVDSIMSHFRNLLVCKISKNPENLLDYSSDDVVRLKTQAEKAPYERISYIITSLTSAKAEAKWLKSPRTLYELSFIKLCVPELDNSKDAMLYRIQNVEEKVRDGITVTVTEAEKKKEDKQEKKEPAQKVSKKLFNPIPASMLHSENPIVKLAKKWEKISQSILKSAGFLTIAIANRQITIDADGLILLYDKNSETLSKSIADNHKSVIESGLSKSSGMSCAIKTAFIQDMEDYIIDYWALPSPRGEAKEAELKENKSTDPLDSLFERVPEIVSSSDDTAFLEYKEEEESFEQSELKENYNFDEN